MYNETDLDISIDDIPTLKEWEMLERIIIEAIGNDADIHFLCYKFYSFVRQLEDLRSSSENNMFNYLIGNLVNS